MRYPARYYTLSEDLMKAETKQSETPTTKPKKTPSQKRVVTVELAVSIAVDFDAPESLDISEVTDEVADFIQDQIQSSQEYYDAFSTLHHAVKFHRETYPKAKAEFTPVIGMVDPEPIGETEGEVS